MAVITHGAGISNRRRERGRRPAEASVCFQARDACAASSPAAIIETATRRAAYWEPLYARVAAVSGTLLALTGDMRTAPSSRRPPIAVDDASERDHLGEGSQGLLTAGSPR